MANKGNGGTAHAAALSLLIEWHSLNFPLAHERLWFDTQGIGHTIDIIEVGDDLRGIVDGAIIKAMCTQKIEISRRHGGRIGG